MQLKQGKTETNPYGKWGAPGEREDEGMYGNRNKEHENDNGHTCTEMGTKEKWKWEQSIMCIQTGSTQNQTCGPWCPQQTINIMHISSNGEVGIKKWRLTAPAEASSVWFFLPLAKSPLLLLSSLASRPASPPLCRYLHFFFFFLLFFFSVFLSKPPLASCHLSHLPSRSSPLESRQRKQQKNNNNPQQKKPLLGWGGLQFIL